MTDSSEIGRYGTLRLLKRHDPETTVAFFPIDDETVTFGRSKECSVRLYYDCVSELHCTLKFSEEHKAFLIVQGTNGLLVDGCQVYPSHFPSSNPTTVPLVNGSEIEIYKKRFKFEYPPKEIRAALLATPRNAKARRSLRMSMIRTAQVFTPCGKANAVPQTPQKKDIRNWEALRSPIKVPSQDGNAVQEMILLEGKCDDVFVVEEEKDLIILEKVDIHHQKSALFSERDFKAAVPIALALSNATPPPRPMSIPQSARVLPDKPHIIYPNRRCSAPSLHRAVVLRSAHRALQRERERFEEQQEEDEVEAEVSPERELGPFELKAEHDGEEDILTDVPYRDEDGEHDGTSEDLPVDTPVSKRPARRMSAFRASLDAMRKVIPLPFTWKPPEEVPLPDEDDDYDHAESEDDYEGDDHRNIDDNETDLKYEQEPGVHTPIRRNLGPFTTPQARVDPLERVKTDTRARASIDGEGALPKTLGGARRVCIVPAWKISDIVLPESQKPGPVGDQKPKGRVSEEERQAIMERRKSALQTPSSLPPPGPRPSGFSSSIQGGEYTPGEDSEENADTMLERMRQKIANMARKSEARKERMSIEVSGQSEAFSLLAHGRARRDTGLLDAKVSNEDYRTERTEQYTEAVESNSHAQDHDNLDILQPPHDDADYATSGSGVLSLTPRYDSVRELFRQPDMEPKTPSFTGFKKMFQERSQTVAKTPSFRGIREMFNHAAATVHTTPRMDLREIFDEDERADLTVDVTEGREEASDDGITMAEDEAPVVTTPTFRTSTRAHNADASTFKRSLRKKNVSPDVPSAVMEEGCDDEIERVDETETIPAPTIRRVAKLCAKNLTTPTTGDLPFSGTGGRGSSRNTRRAAASIPQDTTEDIIIHKTKKATRRFMDNDSEEEASSKTAGKSQSGRGKIKKQQSSETEPEPESEPVVKARVGSRKAQVVGASDSESIASAKPRRVRAAKTSQDVAPVNTTLAPAITKGARRVKIEESPDADDSAPPPKVPKSKRGAKTKIVESVDETPKIDDYLSAVEEITPAPTIPKASKKGWSRKTVVTVDDVSDDKENAGDQQPRSSDKTPAVRTRRVVAVPMDTSDAPARRTRSRK